VKQFNTDVFNRINGAKEAMNINTTPTFDRAKEVFRRMMPDNK
jgi:hypothetical protein